MIQCKPMQSANSYDRYDGIRFVIRSIPIRERIEPLIINDLLINMR